MATPTEIYNEGEKLKDAGELDAAIAKFEEALRDDPNFALAHMALAVTLGMTGKHSEAVEHGQRVAELEPEEAFNFTALSVIYQRAFEATRDLRYIHLAEEAKQKAAELQFSQQQQR